MPNWGTRTSADGFDAKTCSDEDCVFTSKYFMLKGAIEGNGSKTIDDNVLETITIPHSVGYIPFAQVNVDVGVDPIRYALSPLLTANTSNFTLRVRHYTTATDLVIEAIYQDLTFTEPTFDFNYKYTIFVDKGNLN